MVAGWAANMNKFKPNDKVVRSPENRGNKTWVMWCGEQGIATDAHLTVCYCGDTYVRFSPNGDAWSANRFELVSEEDTVKQPKRYELFPGIESIQVIARTFTVAEFRGFCLGNTLKYRLRAGKKDDVAQELAKAEFYQELFERHKGECRAD